MSDNYSTDEVKALAESYFNLNNLDCRILKGDGSDRKIYRINPRDNSLKSVVGVFYENQKENEDFFHLTDFLHTNGIPVPEIYLSSADKSVYLIQDLGPSSLAESIDSWKQAGEQSRIVPAYKNVLDYLLKIQQLPLVMEGRSVLKEEMTAETYLDDLQYFERSFIKAFEYTTLYTESVRQELKQQLVDVLSGQDHGCFVYRDFQSRNIMWLDNAPWFIDYQSAMKGSSFYDPASLLYSSKSGLAERAREQLLRYFFDITGDKRSFEEFQAIFYRFVLIRRLRSLGTYGYLSLVKNKRHFLQAISPTIKELQELLVQKGCLKPFRELTNMIDLLWTRQFAT